MLLRDVMTRRVQVVRPFSTIREAAQIMKVSDIGPLPVCDGDRLVGIVTDRDITVRAVAEGRDPARTQVKDVMHWGIVYAFEDQEVHDAVHLMESKKIRRLVVLNRSKRLVGIVSFADLVRRVRDANLTEELAEKVSEPSRG